MESRAFIKTLNETEVGLTNTNDSYVYIRSDFDFSNFLLDGKDKSFPQIKDVGSKKTYTFRYEKGKEQRLYRLGQYARDVGLKPGDKICIERRIENDDKKYYISFSKKHDIVILRKFKDGYLLMRNDIGNELNGQELTMKYKDKRVSLTINYQGQIKKRKDSPNLVPFYKADFMGAANDILTSSFIELDFNKGNINPLNFENIYFYDLKSL